MIGFYYDENLRIEQINPVDSKILKCWVTPSEFLALFPKKTISGVMEYLFYEIFRREPKFLLNGKKAIKSKYFKII
jgi:hypothetical protein